MNGWVKERRAKKEIGDEHAWRSFGGMGHDGEREREDEEGGGKQTNRS